MNIEKELPKEKLIVVHRRRQDRTPLKRCRRFLTSTRKSNWLLKKGSESFESDERDNALTKLYGEQRLLKDRLEMMGTKPDTIQ